MIRFAPINKAQRGGCCADGGKQRARLRRGGREFTRVCGGLGQRDTAAIFQHRPARRTSDKETAGTEYFLVLLHDAGCFSDQKNENATAQQRNRVLLEPRRTAFGRDTHLQPPPQANRAATSATRRTTAASWRNGTAPETKRNETKPAPHLVHVTPPFGGVSRHPGLHRLEEVRFVDLQLPLPNEIQHQRPTQLQKALALQHSAPQVRRGGGTGGGGGAQDNDAWALLAGRERRRVLGTSYAAPAGSNTASVVPFRPRSDCDELRSRVITRPPQTSRRKNKNSNNNRRNCRSREPKACYPLHTTKAEA